LISVRRPPRLHAFAVEDASAQIVWGELPAGDCVIEVGDTATPVTTGTGPGAVVVEGLPPAATLDLILRTNGRASKVGTVVTLEPPPGRQLARFATVNDMHIGERAFGVVPRVTEASAVERYPVRCLRAALAEAREWGAQLVLAKGDLTWSGRRFQWESVAELLAEAGLPVHAVLGNHDVGRRSVDGREVLADAGITMHDDPWAIDMPGLRIVMVQTPIGLKSPGRIGLHEHAVVELLREAATTPAFIGMHHYPQRFKHPNIYPRGIPGPEARAFLDAVASVQPATFLSCGHSHRHRAHRHGPLVVTEIGSTKDHPGTWAGYVVYEGGIRQVVRRIAEPSVLAWTERAAETVAGVWGLWSPGTLKQRCFSHTWPVAG
jgi:3',5'-cyclic-AMP phosphodiesterase